MTGVRAREERRCVPLESKLDWIVKVVYVASSKVFLMIKSLFA